MDGLAGTYGRGVPWPEPVAAFALDMVIDSPFVKGRAPAVPYGTEGPCGARRRFQKKLD